MQELFESYVLENSQLNSLSHLPGYSVSFIIRCIKIFQKAAVQRYSGIIAAKDTIELFGACITKPNRKRFGYGKFILIME